MLGPSSYGVLTALLNVTAVASLPLAAVQIIVAQNVATKESFLISSPPLRHMLSFAAAVAGLAFLAWNLAVPVIDAFFHLRSATATVVLGVWLIPSLLNSVLEGVLLGQGRFGVVGIGQLIGTGAIRIVTGVTLVWLGFGITGGVLASVAASITVLMVYAASLRDSLFRFGRLGLDLGQATLSTGSLGGAALLTSIDAWLARHFLSAHFAGLFSAASTAGRIALFLPGAITMVYFPRLAAAEGRGRDSGRELARSVSVVSILALITAGTISALPHLVVALLFGSSYSGAGAAVGTVSLADAAIAIGSCFVYYQIARRSWIALLPWPCCALAISLAATFHGSIEILAIDMLVANWCLAATMAFMTCVGHRGFQGNRRKKDTKALRGRE